MYSIDVGIMQFHQRITFHRKTKQTRISPRRSATIRPKRTNRVAAGTIKAMRAVVQRVASASVEVCELYIQLHTPLTLTHTRAQTTSLFVAGGRPYGIGDRAGPACPRWAS